MPVSIEVIEQSRTIMLHVVFTSGIVWFTSAPIEQIIGYNFPFAGFPYHVIIRVYAHPVAVSGAHQTLQGSQLKLSSV